MTTRRRRLLVYSAPVAVILLLVIVKCVSVVLAGNAAESNFAERDIDALRSNVAVLNTFNVIEPGRAHFASGALAVLEDRLDDADREFSQSMARADNCPARVNLVIVRETLGDRAAAVFDSDTALAHYLSARELVEQGCFVDDTAARLDSKINALRTALPPPPPPAAAPAPPPPAAGTAPADPDAPLRLHPESGDPFGRLQQILQDAAARPGR